MSREMEASVEPSVSISEEEVEPYVSEKSRRPKRGEKGLYRIEMEVLSSQRWQRMCRKMGWTTPTRPREIVINGRLRRYNALAGRVMEVSKEYYKRSPRKWIRATIIHELIHYAMEDNSVRDRGYHGPKFERAAVLMGIMKGYKELWECPCGWWTKTFERKESVTCQRCMKVLVRKSELKKLQRIARIGSKVRPVEIERFVEAKVVKL